MESKVEISSNKSFDFNDTDPVATSLQETDEDSPLKFAGTDLLLPGSKKIQKKRTKYHRIDDNLRKKLIDAVEKEGQMLKAAAKRYKINYSSAKSIFHTYRKEGRVNKKAVRERYARKQPIPNKESQLNSLSSLTPEANPTGPNSVGENYFNNLDIIERDLQQPSMELRNMVRLTQIEALEREAKQTLRNLAKTSEKPTMINETMLLSGPNILQQFYLQQANIQRMEAFANIQRALQSNLRVFMGKPLFKTLPQFPLIPNEHTLSPQQFSLKSLNVQNIPLLNGMGLLKSFSGAENTKN